MCTWSELPVWFRKEKPFEGNTIIHNITDLLLPNKVTHPKALQEIIQASDLTRDYNYIGILQLWAKMNVENWAEVVRVLHSYSIWDPTGYIITEDLLKSMFNEVPSSPPKMVLKGIVETLLYRDAQIQALEYRASLLQKCTSESSLKNHAGCSCLYCAVKSSKIQLREQVMKRVPDWKSQLVKSWRMWMFMEEMFPIPTVVVHSPQDVSMTALKIPAPPTILPQNGIKRAIGEEWKKIPPPLLPLQDPNSEIKFNVGMLSTSLHECNGCFPENTSFEIEI